MDETQASPAHPHEVRGRIYDSIVDTIGGTPLVRLSRLMKEENAGGVILGKCEYFNPLSSVKDRIGLAMIEAAERDGKIKEGATLVEPTSGNTGIALAFVCAAKGYKLILTMPESMSLERRKMLLLFGAETVLTPAPLGMRGAIEKAEEIVSNTPGAMMLQQFENPANPEAHRRTTGPEILEAMGELSIDAFVAGVGTGGTITGVGSVLREAHPSVEIVALEPIDSAVLSGGGPGPHKIQGIGAGFVPAVLDTSIYDSIVKVTDEDAYKMKQRLAREEGLLVGISAGANVFAASEVAKRLGPGKNVITVLCDTGERYFSLDEYFTPDGERR